MSRHSQQALERQPQGHLQLCLVGKQHVQILICGTNGATHGPYILTKSGSKIRPSSIYEKPHGSTKTNLGVTFIASTPVQTSSYRFQNTSGKCTIVWFHAYIL
eukprot:5795770-Karenia_brevis.AAC.1